MPYRQITDKIFADSIGPGGLVRSDFERVRAAAHGVTVARLCRSVFSEAHDLEVIKLALEFPYVDEGWKKRLRALLRKAV